MRKPWEKFELSAGMLDSLAAKLQAKPERFSLRSDPLLGSLVSCLGIQFELGRPEQDRFSHFLGLAPSAAWESEIISLNGKLGLRASVPGQSLRPVHTDLAQILHPLSLSAEGKLEQILIFPMDVAANYEKRGIELVVVRDWALTAFLSRSAQLNYQKTNRWELESNIACLQIALMKNRQLAFTGTHDLADHLLSGQAEGLESAHPLIQEIESSYARVFAAPQAKNSLLIASYLIAVILDDLAQPQWYGSAPHHRLARQVLLLMQALGAQGDCKELFLPASFHPLVNVLRDRTATVGERDSRFRDFSLNVQARCAHTRSLVTA